MDGRNVGFRFGRFIGKTKSKLYWAFPWLLNKMYWRWHNSFDFEKKISFWKNFTAYYNSNKNVYFISCENCCNKGIEWKTDKHGWKYEGDHIWLCPDCSNGEKNSVHN